MTGCKNSWGSRIEGEGRIHFRSVWSTALTALEESFFMNRRKAKRFLKNSFASWKLDGFCLLRTSWIKVVTQKPGLTRLWTISSSYWGYKSDKYQILHLGNVPSVAEVARNYNQTTWSSIALFKSRTTDIQIKRKACKDWFWYKHVFNSSLVMCQNLAQLFHGKVVKDTMIMEMKIKWNRILQV